MQITSIASKIIEMETNDVEENIVLAQSPKANEEIFENDTLKVTISKKPKTTTTKPVTTTTKKEEITTTTNSSNLTDGE